MIVTNMWFPLSRCVCLRCSCSFTFNVGSLIETTWNMKNITYEIATLRISKLYWVVSNVENICVKCGEHLEKSAEVWTSVGRNLAVFGQCWQILTKIWQEFGKKVVNVAIFIVWGGASLGRCKSASSSFKFVAVFKIL